MNYPGSLDESYEEPPHHSSQEPSPLDRIYRAAKQKELEKQQQQNLQRQQQQSNNRQEEGQSQRSMFPQMISDFYPTNVPPPPEHLVRKIVPASSESSTKHQVDHAAANIICRQCNERGHHVKNCPQVTCHNCKLKGNPALETFLIARSIQLQNWGFLTRVLNFSIFA